MLQDMRGGKGVKNGFAFTSISQDAPMEDGSSSASGSRWEDGSIEGVKTHKAHVSSVSRDIRKRQSDAHPFVVSVLQCRCLFQTPFHGCAACQQSRPWTTRCPVRGATLHLVSNNDASTLTRHGFCRVRRKRDRIIQCPPMLPKGSGCAISALTYESRRWKVCFGNQYPGPWIVSSSLLGSYASTCSRNV